VIAVIIQLLLIVSAIRIWKAGQTSEAKKSGLIAPIVYAIHWPVVYFLGPKIGVTTGILISLFWGIVCIIIGMVTYRKAKKVVNIETTKKQVSDENDTV